MTASPSWDVGQYRKFEDERARPALDLIGRIPAIEPRLIVDLGCGSGQITDRLARRWPDAKVVGVDSSPAMLAAARRLESPVLWEESDIAGWAPEQPVDLLFSNAALQWLGGHTTLFPRLFDHLAPGGVLAVQMPLNQEAPSHRAMGKAAAAGPWADRLLPHVRHAPVADPAVYYDLLAPRARFADLWETTYFHIMPDLDAIIEWVKGTGLRPLLEALGDAAERDAFLADYRACLAEAYRPQPDGRVLFPFRRLFLLACR
jgi:trans-aconitate 2-methyltransferase